MATKKTPEKLPFWECLVTSNLKRWGWEMRTHPRPKAWWSPVELDHVQRPRELGLSEQHIQESRGLFNSSDTGTVRFQTWHGSSSCMMTCLTRICRSGDRSDYLLSCLKTAVLHLPTRSKSSTSTRKTRNTTEGSAPSPHSQQTSRDVQGRVTPGAQLSQGQRKTKSLSQNNLLFPH